MEPRRVNGKNHWYHETQSTICPVDVLPLVPEAAHVEDRFLLDLTLPAAWLRARTRAKSAMLEAPALARLSMYASNSFSCRSKSAAMSACKRVEISER